MDHAVAVRDVRAWWREVHPPPSLGHRLDVLYSTAITAAIFGAMAYGTASAALSQVVTPEWLATYGPSLALAAAVLAAHWGAVQGPVVFTVPDVGFLLGAPLSRRALSTRRLLAAFGIGAVLGAAITAVVLVGLAGEGRGLAADQAAGLAVGLAELGVLAVAAAWAVQCSARVERILRRAVWPVAAVAAGLAAASAAGPTGREIAFWAGPWGWAIQPGVRGITAESLAALALLTLSTAAAVLAAWRGAGRCSAERHMRRAEARATALASLASFDARSARKGLARAAETRERRGPGGGLPRLRALASRRGELVIAWRDTVTGLHAPGRALESAALVALGTVLTLATADKPVAVAVGVVLVYFGAALLLGPLRAELDVPDRTSVLLRPRAGDVILAHVLVPAVLTAAAAALAAAGCAVAGALPAGGAAAALVAVAVAPGIAGCAAMSARKGGRLPVSVMTAAVATDPSGGAATVLAWMAAWPAAAVVLAAVPTVIVDRSGAGGILPAALWAVAGGWLLAALLRRDPT